MPRGWKARLRTSTPRRFRSGCSTLTQNKRPADLAGLLFAAVPGNEGLALHDVRSIDIARSVASIDHQLRFGDDAGIIVLRVIRDNHNAVEFRNLFKRRAGHVERVFAAMTDGREEGVVVFDKRPTFLQQFDDGE